MSEPDPYLVVSDLIANAVATARVCGENRRISNLVAGSVARFMAERHDGEALLGHALAAIDAADAQLVPMLLMRLRGLSARA